jgi:hypothetical protein
MRIPRRQILALAASFLPKAFGATIPGAGRRPGFDVDRLVDACSPGCGYRSSPPEIRKYVASATVMLFSFSLVSKKGVGSGYAVIEEAAPASSSTSGARTLSIQFGAGSWPENARGLNRLGFIQETIAEEKPGQPAEFAWLAFMTTSKESSLDQAKKAIETSGDTIPYSASQGRGHEGHYGALVERFDFPATYRWSNLSQLIDRARTVMTAGIVEQGSASPDRPATFLYQVRRAILDASPRTTRCIVFNNKLFRMETQKERDATASAHFAERKLALPSACVMRLDAVLTEARTGAKTPFRVWYAAGAEQAPPLRFEYQAKSFLRLTFEADGAADTPPIRLAFPPVTVKENV